MTSLVEEENNKVGRFSGKYLEMDGLKEFHVSRYNPITQKLEPYGVYGDPEAFERQHNVINLRVVLDEDDVFRYYLYFVLEETK